MPDEQSGVLHVITEGREGGDDLGMERGPISAVVSKRVASLGVDALKDNMRSFLTQLNAIFRDGFEVVSGFGLDEVTVSASISADGTVCLLGSGAAVKAQGALTLRLRRQP